MTALGKIEVVSSSMSAILSAHTRGKIFGTEVWVHHHVSWASTWCCRIPSVVFASMLMVLFEFQFATSVGRIGVASSSTSAILSAHTCGTNFVFEFGVHDLFFLGFDMVL